MSVISRRHALSLALPAALGATGCAWRGTTSETATRPALGSAESGGAGWHQLLLPGKTPTRYVAARKDGRDCIHAQARSSASMWRRRLDVPPERLGQVRWAWRVDRLNTQASVADIDLEDAVARIVFAFDGDRSRLSARTQAMFDLAKALTGETPPYATLMYVWETRQPAETVVVNPRSDRIRKWVVDTGPEHLGTWRVHQRDLVADFERAFGEKPGPLVAIGKMTDSDNTRASAEAWYGPIELIG